MEFCGFFQLSRMRPPYYFDKEAILKGITYYRGVYRKYMLPNWIGHYESFVINILDYFYCGGIHWVFVIYQPYSYDAEYFDSFSVQLSNVVVDCMKTSGKGLVHTDNHIIHIVSIMCGNYVCNIILERKKGRPMRDILLNFSKPEANEQVFEMFAAARTGGGLSGNIYWLMSCISRLTGNLNDDV